VSGTGEESSSSVSSEEEGVIAAGFSEELRSEGSRVFSKMVM